MKLTKEIDTAWDVRNLVWSGARDTVGKMTDEEIEQILEYLEECCPEGLSETALNDFLWFEDETICDWLGISTEEWENRWQQEN